ncbi:hypothetical protein BDV25DRAFT_150280 [Aspergillus avenaceus]|uniref:Uncharacterized protein n=1 Tax=Aspergillus avenaceus TaxID=36643 RepID=A0A5N6U362_ASPAV|nr:hypothetical protein BDV25DRAFT_150280 [Aspergillus avenaceus]
MHRLYSGVGHRRLSWISCLTLCSRLSNPIPLVYTLIHLYSFAAFPPTKIRSSPDPRLLADKPTNDLHPVRCL